jgi:hypothetical protein
MLTPIYVAATDPIKGSSLRRIARIRVIQYTGDFATVNRIQWTAAASALRSAQQRTGHNISPLVLGSRATLPRLTLAWATTAFLTVAIFALSAEWIAQNVRE